MERAVSADALVTKDIRNFLVLEHSLALGTALHATPLLPVLHAVIPGARIVGAASGFGLGILQGNPALERLLAMPSPLADLQGAARALRQARAFRNEPFAVLHSTGNLRSRMTLAALLGGAHTRVGFSVHPELVTVALRFDPALSQIANNLRIVAALGHGDRLRRALEARPELAEPAVYPAETDYQQVRDLLQEAGCEEGRPLVVFITQTSVTQRKSWRPERFRQVAEMVQREYDAQIAFGGTAGEAVAIEDLRRGLHVRSVNLAGKTSLLQMAALFGMADAAVTLDTGPMHLGRAMQTPMVIVAPAWSPPVEWLPVGNPRVRILKNLSLEVAPPEYVIDEVTAAEVEEALRDLLGRYPPGSRGSPQCWRVGPVS